jgi:hypothetical protein
MHDFINQNECRIVGMARSGNHAIINWLLSQVQGRYCFLNCVEPKTNPFLSARPLGNGQPYQVNYAEFDLACEQQGHFSRKAYLLYSYEDCFLGMVDHERFHTQHDAFLGPSQRQFDILILRDPFNLFASRTQSGFYDAAEPPRKLVTLKTAIRIWKQHAKTFLGDRRYLRRRRIPISYNRWTQDPAYRREIAETLGLAFTDAGFERVVNVGGGSSFDGTQFDRQADRMGVLDRWQHCADNPTYRAIFDEEMVALSEQLFGPIPGTERIIRF